MAQEREKMIYYVSNLGTGIVSIIDGDNYSVIKEIEIGPRPQSIIIDERNNVYIASDRNSKITLIEDLYNCVKSWAIPNNGNIQVDSIAQKIYACDTEKVCIYDLGTGERIRCLTGFIAADSLALDKGKKRLFILDVLQNEIKVYDTSNFCYIKSYKDIGNSPTCILIGENEREIYIANKGKCKENITILTSESGKIYRINLKKGSIITDLKQNGGILYAANNGLHRIEVIDISKKECIAMIKTTMPKVQRLRLSDDKKILLAISCNVEGKGVIDRIDTSNNNIIDVFTFEKKNSSPYDIGIVTYSKPQAQEELSGLANQEDKLKQESGITILAKKIISTYEEKVSFSEISTKLSQEAQGIIMIEKIMFKKCKIINKVINRNIIENKKEYSILQYDFYIPYCIRYKDEQEQKYFTEGRIKGSWKAKVCISSYAEQQGVQFAVNSFTKLKNTPALIGKSLQFDADMLISIKAIVDEIVYIPSCENCKKYKNRNSSENEKKIMNSPK